VGRLSVIGILALSGILTLQRHNLTVIFASVAGVAVLSTIVSNAIIIKNPNSNKPFFYLLVIDAFLLGTVIYVSGGVDGPFISFMLIHTISYGFYLGVSGGLTASLAGIVVIAFFSALALSGPTSGTTLSPLLSSLVQSGQLKISTSYVALRILLNGLLMIAAGIASGFLSRSLYSESGLLQRTLCSMAELRARSRQILDSLHDGVVVVDERGSTVSMNPAAEELLGTDRPMQKSPLGSMVADFQKNGDFPPVMDIIIGERVLECRFSLFGEKGGLIVIINDTTDLRNYQAALEERDKLALIGRLSATMAHEIRNPLASMSGAAQMLATGALSTEKAERMASLVEKQSRRVSELIEGYLSLSRNSAEFPPARLDLNEVVNDTIEGAMHGFAGGVSIVFNRAEDEPVINGNRVRIGQVLTNLLRNSVEAIKNTKQPTITVETQVSSSDNRVSVKVSDNGPGIPQGFGHRMWEPFETTRDDGTGLGLYIVRRIVEEHGGTIEASGSAAGGAVFTAVFPGAGVQS